jgi:HPt (histidine-containing phosphotransfer) domain-containing protein
VFVRRLARKAQVSDYLARIYLSEREGEERLQAKTAHGRNASNRARQAALLARLEQAYAHLQEQGVPITVKALAKRAGCNHGLVRKYLQPMGVDLPMTNEQRRQDAWQRLDEALKALEVSGRSSSVSELAGLAQTGKRTAQTYLKERQQAQL